MPSLDQRQRKKQRVADSDDDAANSGDDLGTQARRNDAVLAKVDPQYLNTPVDLRLGDSKLRLLAGTLTGIKEKVRKTLDSLTDVAGDLAETLSEDYRDEEYDEGKMIDALKADETMAQLDKDFCNALDREAELNIRAATISDMRGRISQGHQVTNIYKVYEQRVQPKLDEYKQKTPRQRFENNHLYNGYRDLVWENFANGAGVPNVKKFLPREDADEESDDEDVEFGAQTHNFQCPITLTTLEDPYTSTVCPHSFSGAAIKEMIKNEHGRTRCPVPGCAQILTLATIAADEGLKRRVAAHVRRVAEGRTQPATQGRTFVQMDLDSDEEDEEDEEANERKVKKVKKEKGGGS